MDLKEARRMCWAHSDVACDRCGAYKWCPFERGYIENITDEQIEEFKRFVAKWSAGNPPRTKKDELLEKYPQALVNDAGTPQLCPRLLIGAGTCVLGGYEGCDHCKEKYWNAPVEEDNHDIL